MKTRNLHLFTLALLCCGMTATAQTAKPNVLFIAIDDLNHWVRHMGRNTQVRTPNIDRLAKRGVTFLNAYCAAPVCNPSRAALMSGLRPATTGVYENNTDWRKQISEELTLPSHFRKNGYTTLGSGKIYHGGMNRRTEWDDYFQREGSDPTPAKNDAVNVNGIKFGALDGKDDDLADFRITSWAIDQLGKKYNKPFFLACGLHKPHLPWHVPKKWFDLYPLDKIELPKVQENDLNDVPSFGKHLAQRIGDHAAIVKSGKWKEAVQAYLAAISYTDMNVGRLLDALDKSPHAKNTIIVLWGDHGWNLGEKDHWRKFALWEETTRAPLIWVAPGTTKPGGVCRRTVDFMSIYPTLTDLCGMPTPGHVQGKSIRTLLSNPKAEWSQPALTTYLFNNHAVRSEGFRYIRYYDGTEELYDEKSDPFEWTNLAGKPEYASVKAELAKQMPKENAPDGGRRLNQATLRGDRR